MQLNFRSLSEDRPGEAWRKVHAHGWPGWSEWFLARTQDKDPDLREARRAIRRHMPEYEGLWDELNLACGADDDAAHFLSFWSPPRYLVNCSQAVMVDQDGPFLIRNYDLDPDLNEATLLSTNWRGRRVVGMVEGMAGLADGMNDAGLAASLTFGGRVVTQTGFGIPIIMRYILEMCTNTQDAVEALRTVPTHMSYNVTVIDKSGEWATVFLAPDRPAIVRKQPWATNHQLGVEWPRHGRVSNTMGRAKHLETLLAQPDLTEHQLREEFRSAPLFSTNYAQGFGTVYTATYRPTLGEVSLSWKDGTTERWNINDVEERHRSIRYTDDGSSAVTTPQIIPQNTEMPWYRNFLDEVPQDFPDPDGSEHARLAAFWRRNHLGKDRDWSNLNPISNTIPKEE